MAKRRAALTKQRIRPAALVVAAAVLVITVVASWQVWPPSVDTSDSPGGSGGADAAAVSGCVEEVKAADAVAAAARIGIRHWAAHVQARTDLLAGKNSTDTTAEIWKRTRLAGPTDLKNYQAALPAHRAVKGDCARTRQPTSEASADLADCRHRQRAQAAALEAGAAGIGDWESHLAAMAAHADGEMDTEHAQTLWVKAWRNAPPNINAFRSADRALANTPACP